MNVLRQAVYSLKFSHPEKIRTPIRGGLFTVVDAGSLKRGAITSAKPEGSACRSLGAKRGLQDQSGRNRYESRSHEMNQGEIVLVIR